MKTVTTLIAGVALATASAVVNATDVQPTPVFTPFTPFVMTGDQQTALAQHQRVIAEQQRAFAEQQAAAARAAMEAQRRFAEQMAAASAAPTPCVAPVAPFAPFAMPDMPEVPQPFELSQLPAAPSVAGLNPESRRTEMRKFMEERRETVRKLLREQRDAALQERGRYLEQMGRIGPEA